MQKVVAIDAIGPLLARSAARSLHSIAMRCMPPCAGGRLAIRTCRIANQEIVTMHSTQRLVAGSAILLAAMLAASASFAAGIQALNVPADASSPAMSGAVWYPCALPPTQLRLGPFL